MTSRGIGLPATIDPSISRRAAAEAERAGYHSFWLNNPPGSNALESLGNVARQARTIWLGVGIIPLSDKSADDIIRLVGDHRMPLDRFYLGIGSGSGSGGVKRVHDAIGTLRGALQSTLVVAALGPAMCRLAGAEADGVLLNWLTPDFAERSTEWIREGADGAGKPMPRVMAYVRVGLGAQSIARLEKEAANYGAIPHYAAHFERMGVSATDTAVCGDTPEDVQQALAAWNDKVDEIVVRAIPARDTTEDVLAVLEATRPSM